MFYIGYISIWQTMKFSDKIADLSSWLCIIGSIFATGNTNIVVCMYIHSKLSYVYRIETKSKNFLSKIKKIIKAVCKFKTCCCFRCFS